MNAIPTHLGKMLSVTVIQSSKQSRLANATMSESVQGDRTELFAEKDFAHWTKDAAYTTMPFNGQGAAQSIEDAAMLTALFEHVTELAQVEKAFAVYDELRRPRTQKVVELSREFGRMYAFFDEEVRDDLDEMKKRLGDGGKYTNEVDLVWMKTEAVRLLEKDV